MRIFPICTHIQNIGVEVHDGDKKEEERGGEGEDSEHTSFYQESGYEEWVSARGLNR